MLENLPKKIDLTIIGAGTAGAATAIALCNQGNQNVLIIEKSCQDSFRVGETIPPPTVIVLGQLGVSDILQQDDHLPSLGNCSAWGSSELQFQDFLFYPGGHGWHLDRMRFDASLVRVARERGAILLRGNKVIACHSLPDGRWKLTLKPQESPPFSLETSFVVDASGHRSLFAHLGKTKKVQMDSLCGVASVFTWQNNAPKDYYTLIEATELGWWYATRLPRERAIITFLSDSELLRQYQFHRLENWTAYLKKTQYIRELTHNALSQSQLLIKPAFSQYLERMTGQAWLAVGDAAYSMDPLSSSGIYKALLSGVTAAEAIFRYFNGDQGALVTYERQQQQQLTLYQQDRRKYYRQETRWTDSPFWYYRREETIRTGDSA